MAITNIYLHVLLPNSEITNSENISVTYPPHFLQDVFKLINMIGILSQIFISLDIVEGSQDSNPQSCPVRHRVMDRGSPLDGGLLGDNTESMTVDHNGYRSWRVPRFIHAKDVYFEKEQSLQLTRQHCLSLPISTSFFSGSQK